MDIIDLAQLPFGSRLSCIHGFNLNGGQEKALTGPKMVGKKKPLPAQKWWARKSPYPPYNNPYRYRATRKPTSLRRESRK